jgi:hypothetical protein
VGHGHTQDDLPHGSIARLEPGDETSFLLRAGEPTRSVGNLVRITTRV